jgi:hypothetical protein
LVPAQEVQTAFRDYFEERGINDELAAYIYSHAATKENKEYMVRARARACVCDTHVCGD